MCERLPSACRMGRDAKRIMTCATTVADGASLRARRPALPMDPFGDVDDDEGGRISASRRSAPGRRIVLWKADILGLNAFYCCWMSYVYGFPTSRLGPRTSLGVRLGGVAAAALLSPAQRPLRKHRMTRLRLHPASEPERRS